MLTQTLETADFAFRYSATDNVDAAWQEQFHQWAVRALDVTPTRKITDYKYLTRQQMGEVTGVSITNAYADGGAFAVYTLWDRYGLALPCSSNPRLRTVPRPSTA